MAGEIIPAIRDNAHLLPWLPSSSTPRAVKHLSPAERQREFDEAVDHAIPRSGPLALLLVCMLVADKRDVPEDGCDGLGALICDSLKSYGDHFLALYRIEDSATLAAAVDDLVATAVAELDEGLRPTCWLDRDVVHVWAFNRWYIKGSLAPSDPLYLPYLDLMDAILHVLVGLPFETWQSWVMTYEASSRLAFWPTETAAVSPGHEVHCRLPCPFVPAVTAAPASPR